MAYSIVYPPTIDFKWLVQRPQQLMQAFAALGAKVYYMNLVRGGAPKPGAVWVSNNLMVLNDVHPKVYLSQQPIFYFSSPAHVELIPHYNPVLVVFDYLDEPVEEFVGLAPYLHRALTSADLVITSSERLYHNSLTVNPNTILVPNGCDFDHFARAQNRSLPIPDDVKLINPPVVGYHGAIATWLDFDLIVRVADSLPQGHVVMVGPLYNLSSVPQRPNLHWLGYKDFEMLPNYAQLFDVAIIPFRVSPLTDAVNPIKMWEYMAAGAPVVTTALQETRNIEGIYHSVNDDEFIANIKEALAEDPSRYRQARISLARENTWLIRAQQILQAIDRTMESLGRLRHRSSPIIHKHSPRVDTTINRAKKIVINVSQIGYRIPPKKADFRSGIPPRYRSYSISAKKSLNYQFKG